MNALPSHELRNPTLPFPNSWFGIRTSRDLKRGQVLAVPFMGKEIVLYRTQSGEARACEPYCPHMGAHLGHGGRVEGEDLVCPFHGFAYDGTGACVRTGWGDRPPRVALKFLPLREINGSLYIWRHHAGAAPHWEVPSFDLRGYAIRHIDITWDGSWDDLAENSVDTTHLKSLHHADWNLPVSSIEAHRVHIAGTAEYFFKKIRMQLPITLYGPGIVIAGTTLSWMDYKAIVNITPIRQFENRFHITIAVRMTKMRFMPSWVRTGIAHLFAWIFRHFHLREALNDNVVLAYRKRLDHPTLRPSDASIGMVRRWIRQFMPSSDVGAETLVATVKQQAEVAAFAEHKVMLEDQAQRTKGVS